MRRRTARLLPALWALAGLAGPLAASEARSAGAEWRAQDEDAELEALLAEERADAARALRTGRLGTARGIVLEHLDEEPTDAASRRILAGILRDGGDLEGAEREAARALADAPEGTPLRAACAVTVAEGLLVRGLAKEASQVLYAPENALAPGHDAIHAWALGRALLGSGDRDGALEVLRKGADTDPGDDWAGWLARARCERELGNLERASRSLVTADLVAESGAGREPDVLVALGEVYFEADGEVDHQESRGRAPGVLFKKAIELHPHHEAAHLALFRLHRVNWKRQSRPAHEFLADLLAHRPDSIEGLIAGARADLEDGRLVSARERLARLTDLAPARREVRTLEATLAWIEHRRDDARRIVAELAAVDPADGAPEHVLGRTLNELYRFGEALEHLRRSVERDPGDPEAWTQLGRSLANTGAEDEAREALRRAVETASGRQNAWRHNTLLVLERMGEGFVEETGEGELSYAWAGEAAEVLGTYLKPFYADARERLAARYGYTPGPVRIEVFGRHQDFSVRSTGYQGFPALGVCFGPVVTAVSPVSEMRGNFSWARTSFHEFTHVVHLGLSHNRCPRWITEGLATWEEVQENPAWTRNMRRELVDSLANGELIPVRELNRAFRGPRILFGYYQGGLLCRMLIDEHGFPPMVALLEAFDRGLDLDAAFDEVFGRTPEEVDRSFEAFVRREVRDLAIEPRWRPEVVSRLQFSLAPEPPAGAAEREAWAESWATVAWGRWQTGRRVDAEAALRRIASAGLEPPRALFLRAEMALDAGDREKAQEHYARGFELGGEDFRARMALGTLAMQAGELEAAEEHFLGAQAVYPGYPELGLSAELSLAQIYARQDRDEDMQRARERYLAWNASNFPLRVQVAKWHVRNGRHAEALRWFREANEIDPFQRSLHVRWGEALEAVGRAEDALREYRVALMVPPELDISDPDPTPPELRADLLGRQARLLAGLGRAEEAAAAAEEALALDPDLESARAVLEGLR